MRSTNPRLRFALLLAALTLGAPGCAAAQTPAIEQRKAADTRAYSDAELIDGFLAIALGAEFQIAGRVDRIRKYTAPVRVHIERRGGPDRSAILKTVLADIAAKIRNLDLALADDPATANIRILLVRNRDMRKTITAQYGAERARQIERSLAPQCLSGFRKDDQYRILESQVLLAGDVDRETFYDCAYEEILQALGPINDTRSIPWTMFNDAVRMGYFDRYDQHILNLLYHTRIQPGMGADEVRAVAPALLPAVRQIVSDNAAKLH